MTLGARRACSIALVALGAIYVAWLGFRIELMGDYPGDYGAAMHALLGGHLGSFFSTLPTNGAGGSLLLRAPAALLGKLLVGGQLAEFRFGALFCGLAAGVLGLFLARELRLGGAPPLTRGAVIVVCVFSPAMLDAIFFGHPEEPLGAAVCVAAVLLAGARRNTLAGVMLGLAMLNKPWGVLAVLPVLLCAREGRLRITVLAGAIFLGWSASALLADPAHFARIVFGATTSIVAHPVDLWWPLAKRHSALGIETAYFPPKFLSAHARELSVLLALPLSVPLLVRARRTEADCLGLLALLFLLRCALDPSNHVYYQVPLVIVLAAWEARLGRMPLMAMAGAAGFFLVFHTLSGTGSLTAQFVGYMLVALPLALVLGRRVLFAGGQNRGKEAIRWPDDRHGRRRRLSPAASS